MSTSTSRRSRTRVRGRSSTARSKRRWSGSTPKPPKRSAGRLRRSGTSTSRSTRSPSTAPSTSTPRSTSPTPSTSRTPSGPARSSRPTSGRPSRWTYAAPSPWVTSPAVSSPSGSKATSPAGRWTWSYSPRSGRTEPVGRCGNTRSPISVEQIREWCGDATPVTVKPVVDLDEHIHVEAYEAPDRLKDQNALVDVHCVFPHCTKPAQRCDTDHVVPYADGGTDLLGQHRPLCRRHHRAKTHSAWDYSVLDRGTYLWTTPNGLRLIRDHRGTATNPDHPAPHPGQQPMAGAIGMARLRVRVSVRVIFRRSPDVGDPACVNSSRDFTAWLGWVVAGVVVVGADRLDLDDDDAASRPRPATTICRRSGRELGRHDVPGESVTDGDTLRLANGEAVRLVGIDAPENGVCGSVKATELLSRLTLGERVTLTAPVRDRDRYDRLLRYVDVGGTEPAGADRQRPGHRQVRLQGRLRASRQAGTLRQARPSHART